MSHNMQTSPPSRPLRQLTLNTMWKLKPKLEMKKAFPLSPTTPPGRVMKQKPAVRKTGLLHFAKSPKAGSKKSGQQTILAYNKLSAYSMPGIKASFPGGNFDDFLAHISSLLTPEVCAQIRDATKSQSDRDLWFQLRYGRITASTFYDARLADKVYCKTLLAQILAHEKPNFRAWNDAIERGKRLEPEVLQVVAKTLGVSISRSGLILHRDFPVFGASPDGVGSNFVVEIKCPSTVATRARYYSTDGKVAKRVNMQIQLQMLLCEVDFGYLCLADPFFEVNHVVTIIKVDLEREKMLEFINAAIEGWKKNIFPQL